MSVLPEGRYAEIDGGLRIHYHEEGTGFPVVFVHGSGPGASGWSNFKQNMAAFAAAGYRAIVPDLLGYGFSSAPDDAQYHLDYLVSGVSGLLDALGIDRCALVGNSMGGALCIQLALDQPERVRRLVLMAPGGLEDREVYMQMKGIRTMLRAIFDPDGISEEGIRRTFELQLHDPSRITDEILAERYEIARTQSTRVFSTMNVTHVAPRLGELQCPVLCLWGMDDQFCPPSGAMKIAQACTQSRVTLFTECGHWVMVEYPEVFDRLCIDFLGEGGCES